ncbi:hypothetical protein MJO28_002130, partial [Puccinia striiformis f. sp. tritici]
HLALLPILKLIGMPLAVLWIPDPVLFFDEVTSFKGALHGIGMASRREKVFSTEESICVSQPPVLT